MESLKDTLFIVIPAYNEEKNIKKVIDDWYSVLQNANANSRMVVADKGSTDKTHEILLALKLKYPQLEVYDTKYKEHGPKLIALYKYAIKKQADYIFQTDSDGQTNCKEFAQFWKLKRDYDGIFGSRVKREDGRGRIFVEFVVCKLLKLYFNVKVNDANAPFRLMKAEVLNNYINMLPEDFNIPNIMITTYFEYYHHNNKFIDISFKPRKKGKNSVNYFQIFKVGAKAIKDFYILRKKMKM